MLGTGAKLKGATGLSQGVKYTSMTKKNQKAIKSLQQTADDLDNIGLKDTEAWQNLVANLEAVLNTIPKKSRELRELLDVVLHALNAMANQCAGQPLALVDAVWEGLNTAVRCLSGQDDGSDSVAKVRQNLINRVNISQKTAESESVPEPRTVAGAPAAIDTLDDAAAYLIQMEAGNLAELDHLRNCLLKLTDDRKAAQPQTSYLKQAIEIIHKMMSGDAAKPEHSLEAVGSLLEAAMNSKDGLDPFENCVESEDTDLQSDADSQANNPDFDHMPCDADTELIAEFIAEGSDLISSAEEALLSLETDPEDVESVGKVFRAFHTVKGTSAFLDLQLLSDFGHHAESLLSRVRDGEIRYCGGYADLSLRALDMIKALLSGVQTALTGQPLLKPDGYDDLIQQLSDPETACTLEEIDDVTTPRIGDMLVAQGKVERDQIEKVAEKHPDEKLGLAVVKSKTASAKDVGQALRAQTRIKSGQQLVESSVRVSTQALGPVDRYGRGAGHCPLDGRAGFTGGQQR